MLEFKSISKFYITGRGEVFTVIAQSDKSIVGEEVLIDGEKYKVRGMEVQGYLEEGKTTGLLVTKIFAEKTVEELYNQAIINYNNYLDRAWDIYNLKQTGILPIRT